MRYRAGIMRLERPQDLEGRRKDAHNTVVATKEEALGAGANAADLIVVEEGPALVVGWVDQAHFEEIEGFPLLLVSICQ